jgi:hypothetical protein
VKDKLDLIESRLQTLIEGGINLLLPWSPQQILARLLVEAMQTNLVASPDNQTILAPDTFQVSIHPSRLDYWQDHQNFLENIAQELYQVGTEVGFHFKSRPRLVLVADPARAVNELKVTASIAQPWVKKTSSFMIEQEGSHEEEPSSIPRNAFLIVNGSRHVPLSQTVINIGRRLDNHLVIDDPRVSRNHVQLRAIKGRYILFDLNSTGGTFVNGQRISQYTLNPGDVISLAGFPLIYGQDLATGSLNLPDRQEPGGSDLVTKPLKP